MFVRQTDQYQLFNPLRSEEYAALKADIARRGIMVAVELDETGAILDGHHRVRIAEELGIDYPKQVRHFASESEKREHVLKMNFLRRHLDPVAQAQTLARILEERGVERGSGTRNDRRTCATVAQVATDLGIPTRTAYRWLAVLDLPAEQQAAIQSGDIGVKEAQRQARKVEREAERIERSGRLVATVDDVPVGPFDIVYADPPWRYERATTTDNRRIENHYPTMDLAAICGLPIPELCADKALLYLWATAPKLAEAMNVITAWGFEYRTCLVWDKERPGMGYWARIQHELLLVARRGDFPAPAEADRPASVFHAPRQEHSRKPDLVYGLIEQAYPWARKVELFARQRRPGWAVWGAEAGESAA